MDTNQAERPGPRRRELRHCRQCQREELSSHHLEAPQGRPAHAGAQRPECSTVTVLRSLFIKPAAVKAHVVVKALRFEIERVMKKGRAGSGNAPHAFRVLSQFTQLHREDERPRIIVGAIAFGKIRNAENGVLEDSGRISHPGEMTQL